MPPERTYTVTFNATGHPGGSVTVDSLLLTLSDATLQLTGGTLTSLGDVNINADTFRLAGGMLKDTTLGGTGGQVMLFNRHARSRDARA